MPSHASSDPPETTAVTLREYLAALWSRRWIVIAVVVVCVAASLFYSFRQTPMYASSSEVLVLPASISLPQQVGAQAYVQTDNELRIATSSEVAAMAADVIERAGLEPAAISVSSPSGTQTLVFSSRSPSPAAAQATAQAYADAYLEFRKTGLLASVDAADESIDDVLIDLRTELTEAQRALTSAETSAEAEVARIRIASLETQIQSKEALQHDLTLAQGTQVGQLLQEAYLPLDPSSPDHSRAATLGVLIGLALGIGLAFLWERLDQRVRSREDVETSAQVPVLGMVPSISRVGPRLVMSPGGDPRSAEAYRALRARVAFAASRTATSTILVTSPTQGEGKTTTAANLATALAQSDKRTVLVSADLRLPTLERFFEFDDHGRGLADLLDDTASLGDVIVRTQVPNLWMIPSGSVGHVDGLLGSEIAAGLLATIARDADVVIIDTPPVLQASDALDLAPHTDAVILVVDPKRSTKVTVTEAADDLRSVGANLMGVVVSNFDPERFRSYDHRRSYYSAANSRAREELPARLHTAPDVRP